MIKYSTWKNNWLGLIFYSPRDSHNKEWLVLLHLGFQGITELDTDQKVRFVTFKVTPSNARVLCVYAPSMYSIREQQARWCFFKGLQNYIENKNERNENKIILEDSNCTMDKMDRDGKKIQRLYKKDAIPIMSCLNSRLIMNGMEDLWRRVKPSSPEFTSHRRFIAKDPGWTGSILT